METVTCRLLPFATADGPHNMAADEALLESAVAGTASLRCYGWSEPTLSLGYFQPADHRLQDQRVARLPFVRRPTGGDAIVHHFEVTYALALPAGPPWQDSRSWLCRMHRIIAGALATLDVKAEVVHERAPPLPQELLCFRKHTSGDLVIGPSKIVGSSQRRRKGSLLQHGSILLTVSPFAPRLPGIRELSGHGLSVPVARDAVISEFARQTGWSIVPGQWTNDELHTIKELLLVKYTQDSWNCKR